jgi:hypothetical protein
LYAFLNLTLCATHPAHLILFDLINLIKFYEEYKLSSSILCNFLHLPIAFTFLRPNIPFSTLFSNTLNLCSSLSVRDQVSHPHKTSQTAVFCILIFTVS